MRSDGDLGDRCSGAAVNEDLFEAAAGADDLQHAPYPTRLIYLLLLVATVTLAVATLRGVEETVPSRRRPRFSVRLGIATDVRPAFFAAVPCLVATWPLSSLYLSLGAVVPRARTISGC